MNREIEFRGKRLDNGEWLYGDLMHDTFGGCYVYPLDAENLYAENKVDPYTVGEFTGLHDKNGKEIYEGDIVKWAHDGLCYVVAFRRGMFFASVHELNEDVYGGYPLWMICEDNDLCEIIGNIYDNKITK